LLDYDLKVQNPLETINVLIFDEVGLAELAPNNPLKVLHSYLDPSSEDKSKNLRNLLVEKAATLRNLKNLKKDELEEIYEEIESKSLVFVGVSNWGLDVSKTNKMQVEDLVETSIKMLEAYSSNFGTFSALFDKNLRNDPQIKKFYKITKDIFNIAAETYSEFRTYQQRGMINKNMHGSRDYYFFTKYLVHHLSDKMLEMDEEDFKNSLIGILNQSIARNFCGTKDSYSKFSKILKEKLKNSHRKDISWE
jgi:hypothetical protein